MIEIIKRPDFFPAVIICLQAVAGIRYLTLGSWGPATYWLCIVGVNTAVTWFMKA